MNVIETHGLTKRYRRKLAVDNLDMTVAAGDIYGFVGKNGSGKSTTMKMIAGLARPTSGEIILFEDPVHGGATPQGFSRIGALIESPGVLQSLTARDNIVAKAQNNTITSNEAKWQQLIVPFDYDTYTGNDAVAKAVLVTFSTNATPGKGSTNPESRDELYVDDIEFIYNAGLSKLAYNGTEVALEEGKYEYEIEDLAATNVTADQIEAVSDGRGAYVTTTVNPTPNGYKAITTVMSNDFKTINTYTLNINNVTTGINSVENAADNTIEAIYNISGQRINEMQKGVNIVRMSDGTTVKVLKK